MTNSRKVYIVGIGDGELYYPQAVFDSQPEALEYAQATHAIVEQDYVVWGPVPLNPPALDPEACSWDVEYETMVPVSTGKAIRVLDATPTTLGDEDSVAMFEGELDAWLRPDFDPRASQWRVLARTGADAVRMVEAALKVHRKAGGHAPE